MQDIIGIGGIIATIVVGVITCLVTWKVAKKSIEKSKLNYRIEIFPILTSTDLSHEIKVSYSGEILKNPCLVVIGIKNTGNISIENPPIEIFCKNSLLIPAYIEDIPDGYEDKWKVVSETKFKVMVNTEFLNPKQEMKIRLYADLNDEKPKVICPKKDLEFVNTEDELQSKLAKILIDDVNERINILPFSSRLIEKMLYQALKK